VRTGSFGALHCQAWLNRHPQRPRQALLDDAFDLRPLVIERENRLGAPELDVPLQGPELAIGELAGIALLQLIEDGPSGLLSED